MSGAMSGSGSTRWTELVDDLGGLAAAWDRRDREIELADRTRGERARLLLVNRLRRQLGEPVRLIIVGAGAIGGEVRRVGSDWVLLSGDRETLVPVAAILSATDLAWGAVHPDGVDVVGSRLPFGSVIRAIASERTRVRVVLRDGSAHAGTPDSVGRDFFDLAVHPLEDAPRARAVSARLTIPHDAVASVTRDGVSPASSR